MQASFTESIARDRDTQSNNGGKDKGRRSHEQRLDSTKVKSVDECRNELSHCSCRSLENDNQRQKPDFVVEHCQLEALQQRAPFLVHAAAVGVKAMNGDVMNRATGNR